MIELTITLDTDLKLPLYEQIYRFIRQEIRRRQMLPGERLPSSRSLSRQLNVSRCTVDLAYEQLVAEGYLESIPCKGYYVCAIENLYELSAREKQVSESRREERLECRISFTPGGITPGGFPYSIWKKLTRQVLDEADENSFCLGSPQGEEGFRSEIAAYLYHARGVHCRPEQIIVGAGNDYLLMLLTCILGERQKIAMENPSYKSAWKCLQSLGHTLRAIPMDENGIEIDALSQSDAKLVYTMPAHQFPMGTLMPMRRRMQLLAWAESEQGRYIIEDDYDSEFRYKGRPIPSLQGSDQKGVVIYLGTFSRAIAPSIRISYMVLPERLLAAYQENGYSFSATVSRTDQRIMEVFLQSGAFERHLNRMRSVYRQKHDLLLRELRPMADFAKISGENAGAHVLLTFTNGLTEEEAVKRAREEGILVYGLSGFYLDETKREVPNHSVLLGYASLSDEQMVEGLAVLKRIWQKP